MSHPTHLRPDADFAAELEAWNATLSQRKLVMEKTPTTTARDVSPEIAGSTPAHAIRKLYKGDRVIVPGGWDGVVHYIDTNGVDVCVDLDNGPVRGLHSFTVDELEFWSHGR